MKTINLSDLSNSDIKYEISRFPDGQQDIVITINPYNEFKEPVLIKSRFNSFKDLELIIATKYALYRLGERNIHLYIPYLLGARSDRQFQKGGNSYLVDVIAPIINKLQFESVKVIDVHSDVAAACIKNLVIQDNTQLVKWSLKNINDVFTIVCPDGGAEKKIYPLLKNLDYRGSLITASKHRELSTGKILETKVNVKDLRGDVVIIDDICDGGRTFIEIAKAIDKSISPKPKKYLIVTHGIFSAGYKELNKYFDGIYCTNSVKDCGDAESDGYNMQPTGIKQLKVI